MQDGLADNTVLAIHKDKDGFIWFGTGNGISRYDGKMIKSFGTEQRNMKVSQFYESSTNLLWFISNGILYCLDRHRECFIPVTKQSNESSCYTNDLIMVNDTICWSIIANKMQRLKQHSHRNEQGEITSISMELEKEYTLCDKTEVLIRLCLAADKTNVYIINNNCRFIQFNIKKELKLMDKCIIEKNNQFIFPSSILSDDKYIWISFIGAGVMRYHIDSGIYN